MRLLDHKLFAFLLKLSLVVFTSAFLTSAQQIGVPTDQHGVNPPRGTYVIRNAHIVPVTGPDIENGTIVVRDGKISAVGSNVSAPSGAQSIHRAGLFIYPGMIHAGHSLCLVEM